MSSALAKYEKRRVRTVKIADDDVKLRSLDGFDWDRIRELKDEKGQPDIPSQTILMWALAMLEDDGTPLWKKDEGETDRQFVDRISPKFKGIPDMTKAELSLEIQKLTKPPSLASMVKNSEGTAT